MISDMCERGSITPIILSARHAIFSALRVLLGNVPSLRKFLELKRKLGEHILIIIDWFLSIFHQFSCRFPTTRDRTNSHSRFVNSALLLLFGIYEWSIYISLS